MWTDKYQPQSVEELILPKQAKLFVESCLKSGDIRNATFYSHTPGTSKTTTATLLGRVLNFETKVMNGSSKSERGIQAIEDLKNYAVAKSLSGRKKLIVIDEADYLTDDAQAALRKVINDSQGVSSFILTCNFVEKINDPLLSRCPVVAFHPSPNDVKPMAVSMVKRASEIFRSEDLDFDKEKVVKVVKAYFPDFRKILLELESSVYGAESEQLGDLVDDIASAVLVGDKQLVNELVEKNRYFINVDRFFSDFVSNDKIKDSDKVFVIIVLAAKYADMVTRAADKIIVLKAFLFEVSDLFVN